MYNKKLKKIFILPTIDFKIKIKFTKIEEASYLSKKIMKINIKWFQKKFKNKYNFNSEIKSKIFKKINNSNNNKNNKISIIRKKINFNYQLLTILI